MHRKLFFAAKMLFVLVVVLFYFGTLAKSSIDLEFLPYGEGLLSLQAGEGESSSFLDDGLSSYVLGDVQSNPGTSLDDYLWDENTNGFINEIDLSLDPSTFDHEINSPHLDQPILEISSDIEIAVNNDCLSDFAPSRKQKERKRRQDINQCPSPNTNFPSLELPTFETIGEATQEPVQREWCARTAYAGFGNIPVCEHSAPWRRPTPSQDFSAFYQVDGVPRKSPPYCIIHKYISFIYDDI
jgi:hypothetical protein